MKGLIDIHIVLVVVFFIAGYVALALSMEKGRVLGACLIGFIVLYVSLSFFFLRWCSIRRSEALKRKDSIDRYNRRAKEVLRLSSACIEKLRVGGAPIERAEVLAGLIEREMKAFPARCTGDDVISLTEKISSELSSLNSQGSGADEGLREALEKTLQRGVREIDYLNPDSVSIKREIFLY